MSDALGLSWLPALAPSRNADRILTTRAPGDPALVQLGSFLATVMQAQLNAAWFVIDTASAHVLPGMVDGTRDGVGVVRRVFYTDPRKAGFDLPDLPGLFVYRQNTPAKSAIPAQDAHRRSGTIAVTWVPGEAPIEIQRNERDPFYNAVSGSLHHALTWKRHPSWKLASEDAIVAGLHTSLVTSTGAVTLTSFDGSAASEPLGVERSAAVTTSAATGAYNTTEPLLFYGVDARGTAVRAPVYLTAIDGGETVPTVLRFVRVTRVEVPAQLLATGSFTLDWWESGEKRQGSLVVRACGFSYMELRDVREVAFELKREAPDKELAPIPVVGVEALVDVGEDSYWDPDVHAQKPYDIEAHVQRTDGLDFTSLEILG